MTALIKSLILPAVASAISPEQVREQAHRLGVVKRQGKVDAYALVLVVVLELMVRGATTIAQLGHVYNQVTGQRLARSSFWSRFTPELASLLKWQLNEVVDDSRAPRGRPPGVLSGFRDVLAVDATVMKVPDSLRPVWKGTRRNSAKAALKVHAWIRVLSGELVKWRVTPETTPDSKALRVDTALRGVLVLFDMGYSSPTLWRRIDQAGGYFLTRIPAGWNPKVLTDNRRHPGRARELSGKKLRQALSGLKRKVVDIQAEFSCRVRGYAGGPAHKVKESYRVIAVRNPKTGELGLYATNAPEQILKAEDVWTIYRLRWEVETFFKTLKSGSAANEFPSAKKHVVEALVYAGLLRATIAMRARAHQPRVLVRRINPGQWMRWWDRHLGAALESLLGCEENMSLEALLLMLSDPNHHRRPTRYAFSTDELVA